VFNLGLFTQRFWTRFSYKKIIGGQIEFKCAHSGHTQRFHLYFFPPFHGPAVFCVKYVVAPYLRRYVTQCPHCAVQWTRVRDRRARAGGRGPGHHGKRRTPPRNQSGIRYAFGPPYQTRVVVAVAVVALVFVLTSPRCPYTSEMFVPTRYAIWAFRARVGWRTIGRGPFFPTVPIGRRFLFAGSSI